MHTQRLASVDAFVTFDLDDAPAGVGVVRMAPKILADGVELLARATTYAFARFGIRAGGVSAGINAPSAGRDDAVAAFVAEIEPFVADGRFLVDPALGVRERDLAGLRALDPRPATLWRDGGAAALTAAGVVAAAEVMVEAVLGGSTALSGPASSPGSLAGRRVVLDGVGPPSAAGRLVRALRAAGAEIVAVGLAGQAREAAGPSSRPALDVDDAAFRPRLDALATPSDVVVVTGRTGYLDHEAAAVVAERVVVVPASPAPVTARALAVLQRAGAVVVPDFISIAAPLLVSPLGDEAGIDDPVAAVRRAAEEHTGDANGTDGVGVWLAAAAQAEAFLETWQGTLPFGRPLA